MAAIIEFMRRIVFTALLLAVPLLAEDRDARVDWLAKHAVPVRTVDPHDDDFADLAPLRKTLAGARVVMLGEPNHGDGTSFLAKTRLIRFLHEKMGFDVMAFESGLYDCTKAQERLAAGEPARVALRRCIFRVWTDSAEFQPLADYFDAQRKAQRPLELAGVDCQFSGDAPQESFLADLRAQGFADPLVDRIVPHLIDSTWEVDTEPRPPAEEQAAFAQMVERWRASAKSAYWQNVLENLRVFAEEEWNTKLSDNAVSSAMRDRQMGKILVWTARERYPKRKIIVWAATFHNARNVRTIEIDSPKLRHLYDANAPMGEWGKNALGDELYSIGITAAEGEYARMFEKTAHPLVASHDSLEDLFARAGFTNAFLDFHHVPEWMHMPMPGQIVGHIEGRADWTRIVDGVLFVRRMERSHKAK
jgi:erythromycin esterase